MSLTPLGKNQIMKGQHVRPTFKVDVEALLKVVKTAKSEEQVKTAQMFHPAGPDGGDKTKPSSGNPQQKPAPRPAIQQEQVGGGGAAPTGEAVPEAPQGAEPVDAAPVPQVDKADGMGGMGGDPAAAGAGAGAPEQPQEPQKDPKQQQQEALEDADMFDELGQKLAKFVKSKGMACGFDSKADGVTLTIVVKPLVRAPDGQMYEGEDAYLDVRREIRQLVRSKGLIAEGGTQPVALESVRQVDPKNTKTVQYQLKIRRHDAGAAEGGAENAHHHSQIGFVPQNAKPVQPKTGDGQVRPNSRMGQPPEQKATDSEAMFGGMGIGGMADEGGMGAQTLPNILAANKGAVIAALKQILGGN